MRAILTLALSLVASPAWSQVQGTPLVHRVGLGVYALGASLDLHSTYQVLSHGGRENNPLGRLTDGNPTATVALGAAADAVTTVLLYKWLGPAHPRLTTVLLYTAAGVRFGLAASNYGESK